jgi:hypothetical protein
MMKIFIFKLTGTFSFRIWLVRADTYEKALEKLKAIDHNYSRGVEDNIQGLDVMEPEGVLGFSGDEFKPDPMRGK